MVLSCRSLVEYNPFRAISADARWRGRVLDFVLSDDEWKVEAILLGQGPSYFLRRFLIRPSEILEIAPGERLLRLNLGSDELERFELQPYEAAIARPGNRSMKVDYVYPGLAPTQWDLYRPRHEPLPHLHHGNGYPPAPHFTGWISRPQDHHLQSARGFFGCHAQARDGRAGFIEDLVMETQKWKIDSVIVDPASWWPYERSLRVEPRRIQRVDLEKRRVVLAVTRDELQSQPDFVPDEPVNEVRAGTYDYYGRPSAYDHEGQAMSPQGWPR